MVTRHEAGYLRRALARIVILIAVVVAVGQLVGIAQTKISAPKNKYTPEQDLQLGQQAAQQVLAEMPLVHDNEVQAYLQTIGKRLVAAIPAEFQHPQFKYDFRVVDVKDLNAFALPGGPMFVNRGMIQAVKNEGELAGVMAHELSHVALRHGTAQATKATPYEIGEIAGQILGAVVGGTAGQVIATGSQFGIGTAFLRFSREYEKQADILGSHIMAAAGYNPTQMADVFKMLEQQGGGSGAPEWMSDHPNPGNRYAYIEQEAKTLQVNSAVQPTGELTVAQNDLKKLPPAKTTAQIEQDAKNGHLDGNSGVNPPPANGQPGGSNQPVGTTGSFPAPSSNYRTYDEGGMFKISVPDNWQQLTGQNSVRFAPQGAYGNAPNGGQAFLLGVEAGVTDGQGGDVNGATQQFVQQLMQANPNLKPTTSMQPISVSGREGVQIAFRNTNEMGQPEVVILQTTQLDDGTLFYTLNVAPQNQFDSYRSTFKKVNGSIKLK